MRFYFLGLAALALSACQPAIPDSGTQGVGFGDYDEFRASRDAQLEGRATMPAPVVVQGAPLPAGASTVTVQGAPGSLAEAGADRTAAARAAAANSGILPLDASPGNPAPAIVPEVQPGVQPGVQPQAVSNSVGISSENDFAAVSQERDIRADAAMIAQNRAQYRIVEPTELPSRPGTDVPNIVEYALRTTNPVGAALYRRGGLFAESRYERACAAYTSADLAQEDFLANGGPERDRKGLDPDGDGFACSWDPRPFRAVRGG